MRQLGWLNTTPSPREGSKRSAPTESRIERFKREGLAVSMPPNPLPHIVKRLFEIGLTEAGATGEVPLSWREINEWQAATGVSLSAFEARLMRELSAAYIDQKRKSGSENSPPPWAEKIDR